MEKVFALIKNNVVINTIVVDDESFLDVLVAQGVHDTAVRIDGCEVRPGLGWTYLLDNDHMFTNDNVTLLIRDNQLIEMIQDGQE